ncbi:ankyrin repeat domain-containing protein [Chryseobacterium sp. Mn2064]|uniref:ankyrin repeat domain-containing protein n=1 Tax=Chryseobacterium sp. Mn2064 TaxID=3395263 RepID=UPI003BE5340A
MNKDEEIISILENKDIEALKAWINKGGDAAMILGKLRESLIQYALDEIEDDEDTYIKMIEILIENGADVNFTHEAYNAPVFTAIYFNNPKILKLLLDHGADVNLVGEERETPLITAALDGNIELLRLLLPYSSEEFINKSGSHQTKTPLGLAFHFYYQNLEMIELLLQYGANPFVNDGEGYLTIENIREGIDENLRKKILDLVDQYTAK